MNKKCLLSTLVAVVLFYLLLSLPGDHSIAQESPIHLTDRLPEETLFYVESNNLQETIDRAKEQMEKGLSKKEKEELEESYREIRKRIGSLLAKEFGFNIGQGKLLDHMDRFQLALLSFEVEDRPESMMGIPDVNFPFVVTFEANRVGVFDSLVNDELKPYIEEETKIAGLPVYRFKTNLPIARKISKAGQTLYFFIRGKGVYITNHLSQVKTLLEGKEAESFPGRTLAESDRYRDSRERAPRNADFFSYVNFDSLFQNMTRSMGRRSLRSYQRGEAGFGLTSIQSGMLASRTGEEWADFRAGLRIEENGIPFYDTFRSDPAEFKLTHLIPSEAVYVLGSRIPSGKERFPVMKEAFLQLTEAFESGSPGQRNGNAKEDWNKFLEEFKSGFGMEMKTFAEGLGNEIVAFSTSPGFKDPSKFLNKFGFILDLSDEDTASTFLDQFLNSTEISRTRKRLENKTVTYRGTEMFAMKQDQDSKNFVCLFTRGKRFFMAGSIPLAQTLIDTSENGESVADQDWYSGAKKQFEGGLSQFLAIRQKPVTQFFVKLSLGTVDLDEEKKQGILDGLKEMKDYGTMVGMKNNSDYLMVRSASRIQPGSYGMSYLSKSSLEKVEKNFVRTRQSICKQYQRGLFALLQIYQKEHNAFPMTLKELDDQQKSLRKLAKEDPQLHYFYGEPDYVCPADMTPADSNGLKTSYEYYPPPYGDMQKLMTGDWILLAERGAMHEMPGEKPGRVVLQGRRPRWMPESDYQETVKKQLKEVVDQVDKEISAKSKQLEQLRNQSAREKIQNQIEYLKNVKSHYQQTREGKKK